MEGGRSPAERPLDPGDVGLGRLFDLIQEAVVVADTAADRILLWNRAAEDLLGFSKEEALSMPLQSLVPKYLREQHLAGVKRFNEVGPGPLIKSEKPAELVALVKGGSEIFIQLTLTTLENTDAPPSWVMGVIRDVTSSRDSLTGLWNRGRFEEEVTRHLREAQRYDITGAFLFIDLDRLKRMNDIYGHHVGDQALIRLASILKRRLRITDPLARWGGDEFAVLLPRVNREHAEGVARALASSLAEEPLDINGELVVVSASTGMAMYGPESTSFEELAQEADASMYATKRGKTLDGS